MTGINDPLKRVVDEVYDVVLDRHRKYGPLNIANAPGGPLNGLRVRLYDKLARLNNYVDGNAVADFADDKLRDAFVDVAGYALIGLLVLGGDWPAVAVDGEAELAEPATSKMPSAVRDMFDRRWQSTGGDIFEWTDVTGLTWNFTLDKLRTKWGPLKEEIA